MYPVKSIGLLWDARSPTLGSLYDPDAQNNGNALFGPNCANAVYVGGTGALHLVLANGRTSVVFLAVTAGIWMGMPPFVHVSPTSTATGIVIGITAG